MSPQYRATQAEHAVSRTQHQQRCYCLVCQGTSKKGSAEGRQDAVLPAPSVSLCDWVAMSVRNGRSCDSHASATCCALQNNAGTGCGRLANVWELNGKRLVYVCKGSKIRAAPAGLGEPTWQERRRRAVCTTCSHWLVASSCLHLQATPYHMFTVAGCLPTMLPRLGAAASQLVRDSCNGISTVLQRTVP